MAGVAKAVLADAVVGDSAAEGRAEDLVVGADSAHTEAIEVANEEGELVSRGVAGVHSDRGALAVMEMVEDSALESVPEAIEVAADSADNEEDLVRHAAAGVHSDHGVLADHAATAEVASDGIREGMGAQAENTAARSISSGSIDTGDDHANTSCGT